MPSEILNRKNRKEGGDPGFTRGGLTKPIYLSKKFSKVKRKPSRLVRRKGGEQYSEKRPERGKGAAQQSPLETDHILLILPKKEKIRSFTFPKFPTPFGRDKR